jgi:transketolase
VFIAKIKKAIRMKFPEGGAMKSIQLDIAETKKLADTIRVLAAEAVEKANSGHPGMPMGTADLAAALWSAHLSFDSGDPEWMGRDRFVLSAGHGSMLLYSLLHLFGFDLSLDDIKNFRQLTSKTPGHPERGDTPGVEVTTGPLGQGIANAVGMAIGAKMGSARFASSEFDPFDMTIYALAGDGCMMEGISCEAASFAGHLGLDNLVVLYDKNEISIEGSTDLSFTEDVGARFEAMGWFVSVVDGHDAQAVSDAIAKAKGASRPALIICNTHIAFASPGKQDSADSHGAPLGAEDIREMKEKLGWPEKEFFIPEETAAWCAGLSREKKAARNAWDEKLEAWKKCDGNKASEYNMFVKRLLPEGVFEELLKSASDKAGATRGHSGEILQVAAELCPYLIGGSADLAPSNKSVIKGAEYIAPGQFTGRNFHFGVREHAMAAIANGMAAFGGWRPYVATFLVFSDYMRASIRLSALMQLPVIYIFTHDSFQVGEDGPTHQPIEHVESLRNIPGLRVLRPADAVETAAAWYYGLTQGGPTAIILSRQKLQPIKRELPYHKAVHLSGGQIVIESLDEVATLVATGSEVTLAIKAAALLKEQDIKVRVVSLLNRERFLNRPEQERHRLIPYGQPVCTIEAGVTEGWAVLTGRRGLRIGLNRFGASAPASDLEKYFGFTPEIIAAKVRAWLIRLDKLGRLSTGIN